MDRGAWWGYSPWGHKELDMTERLTHFSFVFPQTSLPSRLAHNIEQSSLCYAVGPCWLPMLNIAMCTCILNPPVQVGTGVRVPPYVHRGPLAPGEGSIAVLCRGLGV